jgi:hypothetical protein
MVIIVIMVIMVIMPMSGAPRGWGAKIHKINN